MIPRGWRRPRGEPECGPRPVPPFDAAPLPERPVDPIVLRAVWHAIRDRGALAVRYQSMSRPSALRRTIEPHALAHDGFRWHARSFDRETGTFRDFVLGRLSVFVPVATRRRSRATTPIGPHS